MLLLRAIVIIHVIHVVVAMFLVVMDTTHLFHVVMDTALPDVSTVGAIQGAFPMSMAQALLRGTLLLAKGGRTKLAFILRKQSGFTCGNKNYFLLFLEAAIFCKI